MAHTLRLYQAPGRRDALHPERWCRELEVIVWHFTGGAGQPGFESVPELGGCALSGRRGVGWHVTIPRDCVDSAGQPYAYQHYAWDQRVGHAKGSVFQGRENVNGRSIAIEIANLGPVIQHKGQWVSPWWLHQRDRVVPLRKGREVFQAEDGSFWEAFDTAQLEAAGRLKSTLDNLHPGIPHVRHQDILATKPDTGPAFPWPIPTL